MKKIILLSVIAILLGISDAEAQPANKTYVDMKSGFRLSYPNTWQQTQTAPGSVFSILKKDKSAGISVNLTDFVGNKDKMIKEMETEKSRNSFISELRQRYPDVRLINHKRTSLGKQPAILFSAKYSTKISNAYSQMVSTQIVAINGKKMYAVNFDCIESAYIVNYDEFEEIADTFRFIQ